MTIQQKYIFMTLQQKYFFLLQVWAPQGKAMLVHSTNEEQKKVDSWCHVHFCHSCLAHNVRLKMAVLIMLGPCICNFEMSEKLFGAGSCFCFFNLKLYSCWQGCNAHLLVVPFNVDWQHFLWMSVFHNLQADIVPPFVTLGNLFSTAYISSTWWHETGG